MRSVLQWLLVVVFASFAFTNLESAVGQEQASRTEDIPDTHKRVPIHGFELLLNKTMLDEQRREKTDQMLQLMDQQLERVSDVVPKEALRHLRTVRIWVNPPYDGVTPTAEYHPGAGWLRDNNRNPAMAKCVEVTDLHDFKFEDRRMPWLMLHELSHAYHDQVLGSKNVKIRTAFENASESGKYEEVDRFDGNRIIKDRAYALSNPAEYFAETTEAFFGQNDFFPFDRWELKSVDPEMHELLAELWGVEGTIQNRVRK